MYKPNALPPQTHPFPTLKHSHSAEMFFIGMDYEAFIMMTDGAKYWGILEEIPF